MTDDSEETVSLIEHAQNDNSNPLSSTKPTTTTTTTNKKPKQTSNTIHLSSTGQIQWKWLILILILVSWIGLVTVTLPKIWPSTIEREGHNLVYWTPHKTGSTSMRRWLASVATELNLQIGIVRKYPNKLHEDYYARAKRMGLVDKCGFIAGHIRVTSMKTRSNELKLGAVISTIREPYALLTSKYFHRNRRKLTKQTLGQYRKPESQMSRLWFFYWNDIDPCEQLRYYDGEEGCNYDNLDDRIRKIADRIDCIIDTDDPDQDLSTLCKVMDLNSTACPQLPHMNVKNGSSYYDKLMSFPHIVKVMGRAVHVTAKLRDQFLSRRCRFLDGGLLTTPGMKPPQWPFRGCSTVESSLNDGSDDDAPENDAADDTILDVSPLPFEN